MRRISYDGEAGPRIRGYQEKLWMEQFEQLILFKKHHGHCLVPHTFPENPILARWVKRQRYQYKLKMSGKVSTITEGRIQKLESIGFVWDSHASTWIKRFQDLRDFREKHGHCNVPHNYSLDPELATWVKCQRRQYKLYWSSNKASGMTLDRMEALNKLGFAWKAGEDCPSPSWPLTKVVQSCESMDRMELDSFALLG